MGAPPAPPDREAPQGGSEQQQSGDCPRCGTPFEAGQEYCLECGLRLPQTHGLVAVLSEAWQRRIPWYPGDWIWVALLALLVAGISAGAAIAFTATGEGSTPIVATHATPTAPTVTATTPTGTIGPPPEQPTTTQRTTTAPKPKPAPPKTLRAWPAGESGYTVVLNSVPTAAGRAIALAQARRALAGGLADVGVIDSSKYSSLHTGYFVVFSGVYSSRSQADSASSSAHANGYQDAYVAQVSR